MTLNNKIIQKLENEGVGFVRFVDISLLPKKETVYTINARGSLSRYF